MCTRNCLLIFWCRYLCALEIVCKLEYIFMLKQAYVRKYMLIIDYYYYIYIQIHVTYIKM